MAKDKVKEAPAEADVVSYLEGLPDAALGGLIAVQVVEHLRGVSEDAIEAHEQMAGVALAATVALGTLSMGLSIACGGFGLLVRRCVPETRRLPTGALVLVLLVAGADAAILGMTGKLRWRRRGRGRGGRD